MKNSTFLRRFSLLLVIILTSGLTSWITSTEAHIRVAKNAVLVSGNLIPKEDNVYALGTSKFRWKSLQLGPGTLFIQDQVTGDQAGITVNSGSLLIDGADSLRIGNIQLTATGIKTLTPNTDLTIGDVAGTGRIKLARDLEFPDGTIQKTASVLSDRESQGDTGPAGVKGDIGPAGVKGSTGAVGETGKAGSVGAPGLTGATGKTGEKGDTGMSGGPQGFTGATGAVGETGATGATGASGTSGYTARDICIVKTTGVILFGTCSSLKQTGTTTKVLMK